MAKIIICGKGRIGSKVFSELTNQGHSPEFCYLDKNKGLDFANQTAPNEIDLLIVCISPAKEKHNWGWAEIFDGLSQQNINIKSAILVSSTRVYDGITSGMITSSTPAESSSLRGKSLIKAEQKLQNICSNTTILRCAGLIGENYERYEPMLAAAEDRPRFGIDVAEVIKTIVTVSDKAVNETLNKKQHNSIAIVTNGKVHYQHKIYNFNEHQNKIEELATKFVILVPSK